MQAQTNLNLASTIPHENILVIPRAQLFSQEAWQGLRGADQINLEQYLEIIKSKCQFLPRPAMEQDPRYKQVIPYLIFRYQGKLFLMQRSAQASEVRLRDQYSLGIGGHIRQEDLVGQSIFDWARREFAEEVIYDGKLDVQVLGILNDDSNEVGRVHLGLVLLLTGDSDQIEVSSELKSGKLMSMAECAAFEDRMENWSKLVFDFLQK